MGNANSNCKCDVFLNHRGPDTKMTIASLLYWWLTSHGLQVFLDFQELKGGRIIRTQIKEAIASASLYVAIFSPRYAESTWCLEELHLMTLSGKPIIPIFYQVKPTDLRGAQEHRGAYAAALDEHERKIAWDGQPRHNSTTVLKWRNALSSAAEISGFDLDTFNGDLGRLLFKVFECVFERVEKPRILLKYLKLVPCPWRGIKEFNGGIEEFTDLSHDVKGLRMMVLKVALYTEKSQRRALITICRVEGVESSTFNEEEKKFTVIGSTDPVILTRKLRKFGFTELLSVGPAREIQFRRSE